MPNLLLETHFKKICLLLLLGYNLPTLAGDKHFLWHAEPTHGQHIYLLGALHFGVPDMYPLPPVIMSGYNQSDELVVEADILNSKTSDDEEIGAYTDGTTLQDHLPSSIWQKVQAQSKTFAIPEPLIMHQKPWSASITLSVVGMSQYGMSSTLGIDYYFLQLAHQHNKDIQELESVKQQLEMMNSLPEDLQIKMLESSIEENQDLKTNLDNIIHAWKSGSLSVMKQLILNPSDQSDQAQELQKILFTQRNHNMRNTILRLSETGKSLFIVVGSGHLPGEQGLIKLLVDSGFSFKQL